MIKNFNLLIRISALLPLVVGHSGLQGQEESPDYSDSTEVDTLEPVYMFGSLFTPHQVDTKEPITFLSPEDIELMGVQRPIEALRLQPMMFGAMNTENDSNGGTGSASPNIHGLGTLRTLNLINGRRAGGNSAFNLQPGGFANYNLIPQAAIAGMEILPESASTTYGSDAIAGAINVDLIRRFEGVQVSGLYGDTTSGGGQTQQYSLTGGFYLDEDTHLTLLGSFYDQQVIWARDRSLSSTTDFRSRGGTNRGSSTFSGRANLRVGGNPVQSVLAPGVDFPTSGASYVPYNQSTDAFNYNQYAPVIPALEIANGYAALEHELSEQITLYGDFLYAYSNQDNGLAPAPWSASNAPGLLTAVRASPHTPVAPTDVLDVSYRNFEEGNLLTQFTRNAFRVVGGARGIVDDRWEWDSALLYTQTDFKANISGISDARLLIPHINSGLFNPYARSVTGVNGGIAFDNATALNAASIKARDEFYENLFSYDATVSGEVFKLPAGSLTSAVGAEIRYESIDATPDPIWGTRQNLGGTGYASPFSGKREVFALFNENRIPLISSEQKITGIHQLDLSIGLRYENFSDQGDDPITNLQANNRYDNFSWEAAIQLKPIESVTLRGSYSTGFRAPTLFESYASDVFDFPILVDPTGATPPGTPIPTLVRGNPNLDPETSQSWNASAEWQPEPVPGLTLRATYYYVNVDDAIANGAQFTLDNDPSNVIRRPDGTVALVNSKFFNASSLTTQGMDYTIEYERPLSTAVSMVTTLSVNQVISYEAVVPGVGNIDFAGNYIDKRSNNLSPGAIPKWRGLYTLFFFVYDASLGATVQYIGSYNDDSSFTAGNQPRRVSDYATLNLVATYEFKDSGSALLNGSTVAIGVDNVFNSSPPFAAGAFADGYDTSLYSIQNRFIYGSISKKF
ncbi:TonB-dependent receptor domain-containing protein [Cerasicoccus fimbriatus]|uniref:TonB-dependent receptor domain-containing protein n=1 Tax=Cerasicoccus fimbriatus TaxID=3014554 RepID=UPI0022B38BFC|nr:TonB-dependent receptor [Cerasicoccus sp. TK19100]